MNTLHHDHPNPEGECIFRVASVVQDDDAIVWSFCVEEGECQGSHLRHITLLTQDQLWKLRNLLETLGIEIIDGPMDLNLDEIPGLTVGGLVRDGQIIDFWPLDEEDAIARGVERPPITPVDAQFTQTAIDKARVDLDRALEVYVRARTAEYEDIERQRWRARSKAQ